MATLTPEELDGFATDPLKMQNYILDYHERIMNGNYDIVDPTSPFQMLLESSCVAAANSTISHVNIFSKLYPRFSSKKEDNYRHLSDAELTNMFTVPSEAKIVFMINIPNLKQLGYRPVNSDYVMMTIPEYTEVTVGGVTFTLLNDINIRLYDDGEIFVEQQISNLEIGVNDIGIIQSYVNGGSDGVSWILFETTVKQVKRRVIKDTIIIAEGYDKTFALNDQYFYSNVTYKNENTGGEYIKINKSHSDEYIDPYVPTIYINHSDESIQYKIPDVYLVEKIITGNLNIELFETKGKLYLPINKYNIDNFTITIGNYGKSESAAVTKNIMMLATSRYIVDGGMNEMTYTELQDSIIYNTTGNNDLPITDYEIKQIGTYNGFDIFKALDIVTERLYIASKNMTELTTDNTTTRADVFINTVKMILDELPVTNKIYTNNDIIIIKSGAVFMEDDYTIKVVSDYDVNVLNSLSNIDKELYLSDKKYFVTPLYYIIDKTDDVVNSRIYDMDQPTINYMKLIGKNNNMNARVNTSQAGIVVSTTGYIITFSIITNTDFDDIDPSKVFAQLSIPITNSNLYAYYTGQYDFNTKLITFTIDSDFYIDEENNLVLTNGDSVVTIINTELTFDAILHIYALDSGITDDTKYLHNELNFIPSATTVVFSKEVINITLGKQIEYLWNRVNNIYSDRIYQKYTMDVPLVYEEDVYEIDPATNTIFSLNKIVRSDRLTFVVANSTTYTIVLNSNSYSYTSDADATIAEIQAGMIAAITDPDVLVTVDVDDLIITATDTANDYTITENDPNITLTNIATYDAGLTYNLLHSAGDPVLDGNNDPVYEHLTGDNITDSQGLPIVDQEGGVIRYIDVLMVEYIYKLSTTNVGKNYYSNAIKWITDMLLTSVVDLNKNTLENTKILYKSYKSVKEVKVMINDNINYFPYVVTPSVTLYSERGGYSETELDDIKAIIGKIIHAHLDKETITYKGIKDEIIDTLGTEFVGVGLKGLNLAEDIEVFSMYDKATRMVIDKELINDINNNLVVRYNIDLHVTKI